MRDITTKSLAVTRTLAVFTILRTAEKSILRATLALVAISFFTACSNVEPTLKSLGVEMQTLSFSGSTEKTFRIYSLASLQTIAGQCDARVESLSFSLDESTWAASTSSAFMDSSSDLDCRDGAIKLVIDPSQFNFGANLAEGESSTRTIWIRGSTPWGTAASAKVHVTYVKDTTSPSVGSLATSKGIDLNLVDGSSADVTGTCTTGDGAVSVSARDANGVVISAAAIPCLSGTFIAPGFSFSSLSDGLITITASQTDEAGNPPGTATLSIVKDLVAPVVSMTTPAADGVQVDDSNRSAFLVSGGCTNGDPDVVLQYDGVGIGTTPCGSSVWTTTLDLRGKSAGSAVITARQTDALGNTSSVARQVEVTLSLPTLTIDNLASLVIVDAASANVTITGLCSDSGQMVALTAPSSLTASNVCSPAGSYSMIADFSSIADTNSPIPVTVSHSRVGGGTKTASTTILKKDTVAPTPPTSVTLAKAYHNSSSSSPAISYSGQSDVTSGVKKVYAAILRNSDNAVIQGFTAIGTSPSAVTASSTFVNGTVYRVELKVEDNVGKFSSVASQKPTWTYDNVAPAPTFAGRSNGQSVGTNAFNPDFLLSGTCEAGVPLAITGTGISGSATYACASGSWSHTIPASSFGADGPINYQLTQTDVAGNTGTTTLSLTLDRTPPSITISSPGLSTYVKLSNQSAFTVTGTCQTSAGAIEFLLGSTNVGFTTCSSGAFNTTVNLSSAADGAVVLTAKQTDSASNVGTDTETFTKDTIAPSSPASITLGTANSADTAQSPAINYSTISDPNGILRVEYKILDVSAGNSVVTDWATAPAPGGKVSSTFVNGHTYRLQLRAIDVPGNVSSAFATQPTWTVDTTAPIVAITNHSDEGLIGVADVSSGLTISGTCETGLNVEYWGTGFFEFFPAATMCSGGTFSYLVPTDNFPTGGRYTFYARQTDLTAINTSTVSVDLTLDKTPPVVAFDTPTQGSYVGATNFNVGGTCTAGDLQVDVKVNGTSVGSVSCSGGRFSKTITVSGLSEGTQTILAKQYDLAGNSATETLSVTKDTIAPTMGFIQLVKNFSSSTTASAALTYDYADDGTTGSGFKHVETRIKDANNTVVVDWGVHTNLQTRPGTFVEGAEYSVEARYVDNANNISVPASVGNFRVDTIAPVIDFVFVDHTTADVTQRITPTVQSQWTDVGSGVALLKYSIKNRRTGAAIATNQIVVTNLALFNAGRTLGPFGSTTPFNLTDSFEISIIVEDQAGNASDPSIATWEACPPESANFARPESEHPSVSASYAVTVPERCAGKAVLISATGEAGRQADGNLISAKGVGSGAFATGIFSGAELAGTAMQIKFGGAGPAGHGSTANAARWGGRYASVTGRKNNGSRYGVIAGGGGGMGADMSGLGAGAVNLPGLGGDRWKGQGKCNPAGTANDRAICGVNGNLAGTGSMAEGGVIASGGTKGLDVGVCAGYSSASNGQSATLDFTGTEGSGGRGLEVSTDVTKSGGGGGGGFGGGGGGGSYSDNGNCYGGSGGGGGSIVYGHIPGTVEAIVAGASQAEAYIEVTYGVALPSVQCPANFIYIPRLRNPDGYYDVNPDEPGNGFCISKFEISGTLDQPKSAPLQEPITNATEAEAKLACSKFGDFFKLASNEHWQSVAQIAHWNHLNWQNGEIGRTRMNVGLVSSTKVSGGFAAGDDDANPCYGTSAMTCSKTVWNIARRTHNLGVANDAPVIWDLSGSMKELVEGQNTYGSGASISASVLQSTGASANLNAFGHYYPTARYNYGEHVNTSPYLNLGLVSLSADLASSFTRGSSHGHTTGQAGIFTIQTTTAAGEVDRGFRCVKEPRW